MFKNGQFYNEQLKMRTQIYIEGASAPRGRILDVNGKVLVDNIGVKTIVYNKLKDVTTTKEIDIANKLANILSVEKEDDEQKIKEFYMLTHQQEVDNLITAKEYTDYENRKITTKELEQLKLSRITNEMLSNYTETDLKTIHIYNLMNKGYLYEKKNILENVSDSEYALVIEQNIEGITGELTWNRTYPYGDVLKKIFGTVSNSVPSEKKKEFLKKGYALTDRVGISYLESEYEEYLKGQKAIYKVNSDNTLSIVQEEQKGNDLVLSIDIDVQMKLEEILRNQILAAKKMANTNYFNESYAIVSNPQNGSILAIGGQRLIGSTKNPSWEDVNLNIINNSYTVGSIVKGASMTVGYQNRIVDIGTKYRDACVKLYLVPAKCSYKSLGVVDDVKALANSSNYYQFMIAIGLTKQKYKYDMKLNATANHFKIYRDTFASYGLGVKTGVDLPDEKLGIIGKTVADDLLLNLAIGQYDTYTPIELLQYINTIANNGKRISPAFMKQIVASDGKILMENPHKVIDKVVMEDKYFERIKTGLNQVMLSGTGKNYVNSIYNPAGKTGTSETLYDSNNDGIGDVMTITSSFITFFPIDNPQYSMVVIAPNVSHNNGSYNYKAPVNRLISREISDYLMTRS